MAASSASLVFLSSLLLVASHLSLSTAQATPPLVPGLSYDFYRTSCPSLEPTIREYLAEIFNSDFGLAPGLLRVHFHDCFVQGCEGSVLLAGSVAGPGEQGAPPNLSLRPRTFVVINELRNRIHRACGPIVSCSDITAICARDSVFLLGGPDYRVPLGRRDGLDFATIETTNANLPSFRSNASVLLTQFAGRGLDATDLVALSGGHTYGRANCGTMVPRLYPTQDPTMNSTLAANLTRVCPTPTSAGVNPLDVITPNPFDNAYYRGLLQRLGMFTSDQDLFTNTVTRPIVTSFANNQTLFYQRFAFSMIRMGMMNVLTGTQGEIRTNCSRRNSATSNLYDLVDEEGQSAAF